MATRANRTSKPARAFGRSLSDFPNLTPAEKKLLDHCKRGEMLWLAGKRPQEGTPENTIRPGLIRFLILGGDEANPVHEIGVQVHGAWITRVEDNDAEGLDLENASTQFGSSLWDCIFQKEVVLRRARLPFLSLD